MNKPYITVSDQLNKNWKIYDAKAVKWSKDEYGYSTLSFNLIRNWQYAWRDFALNNMVSLLQVPNKTKWQGRLETIELNYAKKKASITVTASGYRSTLSDMYYHGSIPAGTWESQLTWLIANGYAPYIQAIYTYLYNSGKINQAIATGNGGTDDETIFNIMKRIVTGNLSDGSSIQLQIWDDRILSSVLVQPSSIATPTYRVPIDYIESFGLRRSLLTVENIVRARYKDIAGNVQYDDSATDVVNSGKALGKDFGAGLINYIRMHILDLTNLKNQSSSSAATAASRLLAQTKTLKNDSKAIVLNKDAKVYEIASKRWIDGSDIKTATYIEVTNLFPRTNLIGTGTSAGDTALQQKFYITKVDCDDTGKVSLTPETSSKLSDVVS